MRRLIAFHCAGETLLGSLDEAEGSAGLLIVTGGNEVRVGAHRGMALMAARLAATGLPVLRFDRRGVGDSTGDNRGFEGSSEDLMAAAALFRREQPQLTRLIGFGNCDAASALAMFGAAAGIDALVLANPWVIEPADDLPPAAAIRARYARAVRDPASWARLLRGGINVRKLARGVKRALRPEVSAASPASLVGRIATALAARDAPVTILLAARDNTAVAFRAMWETPAFDAVRTHARVLSLDSASHSFARGSDAEWLFQQIRAAIEGRAVTVDDMR